jgi:hypothetical protein
MNCDSCVGVEAEHHQCDECVQDDIAAERAVRAELAASKAKLARQRAEIRRLREAVGELLLANGFGMSVTGGWDDAHLDPMYLQCVRADRLGRAALKPRRGKGSRPI